MKKANITLYFTFIILAGVLIIITGVLAPAGSLFSTHLYAAGEDILQATNDSIANINDADVRDKIYSLVAEANAAQENNIEVSTSLYKYSWLFVLILVAIVAFVLSRRNVEYGYGGFV